MMFHQNNSYHIAVDLEAGFSLLLQNESNLVFSAMRLRRLEDSKHWRVKRTASIQCGVGLGTLLYEGTIAALSLKGYTLSPDDAMVSDSAKKIWLSLWRRNYTLKHSLPMEFQSEIFNLDYTNDLTINNQYNALFSEDGDPQTLREAILNEELNPHVFNYSYTANKQHETFEQLSEIIEFRRVTIEEIHAFRCIISNQKHLILNSLK
jgi:hypothetical protein